MPFKFPLSRITVFFTLGIITFYYLKIPLFIIVSLLFISLFLNLYFLIKDYKSLAESYFFGISLCFLFFCIGSNTLLIRNSIFDKNHYVNLDANFNEPHFFELIIREKLKSSIKHHRFFANIIAIDNKTNSGKVLINLKKDSLSIPIDVGSRIVVNCQLLKNFKPNNPNQFDYGEYLKNKGIYAQLFINTSQIKTYGVKKNIWFYASCFRNNLIKNLAESGFKKEELAVVHALILGQQQDISPEIMKDYQYAGVIHILSVSGLHVGFIMLLVGFILKPIPKNKIGNIFRLVVTLLFLWLFAIVTGMSASVIRSVTMFSFIAIEMHLNRKTDVYHNILISIFVILLFEPSFLFDIGFQLSYIAVFFILWFEPILRSLWKPKNTVANYFWSILTVSFAAQIGTLPLSIYYFHQFPGLFFVANLILIPCLTIIMSNGLVLLLLSAFNFVPHYLLKSLEVSITLMNRFINLIASIESFVIKDIPFGFPLLISSYLVIISWIIWLKKRDSIRFNFILGSLILFEFFLLYANFSNQVKTELIVFNVPKQTIILERRGKNIKVFSNSHLEENGFESKMISSYATAHFCKIKETKKLSNTSIFNGTKILIIDQKNIYNTSLKPDFVILTNSPKINLERVVKDLKPKLIIADGSNYKAQINLWKSTCIKTKTPFHSTYEKGYYCLE